MASDRQTEILELKMPDGAMVRGTLSFAQTGNPAVVFAHGFGSTRGGEKSIAFEDECTRRGWAYAACDFRGHGDSGGTMLDLTGSRLIEDLDSVTRAVTQRTGGPLFLVGSSMGAWTAAWLAALNPQRIRACGLIAPAFSFPGVEQLERTRPGGVATHGTTPDPKRVYRYGDQLRASGGIREIHCRQTWGPAQQTLDTVSRHA